MELREIFQILKRKLWLAVLIVIVSTSITIYTTKKQRVNYETSSIITVQANREITEQYQYNGYYGIQASNLFINTITGWIKSPTFIADIYKKSNINFDESKIKSLGKNIYAQKIPPQNLVLTVREETQEKSIDVVESIIIEVRNQISQLSLIASSTAGFEIINSEPITVPVKSNLFFNIIIVFIVSFVISIITIFFLEYLSPTINNFQRAKNIFKKIPISLRGIKMKGLANQETKEAEKFRFIRSNMILRKNEGKDLIIVAGIGERVNTSVIASNLALSFARSGKKTVLVDADFANPTVHEYFGKSNECGFSEFLFDENNIDKYLQKTDEANLRVMSSGIKLSYASDTIERANIKNVLEAIKKENDIVIVHVSKLNDSSEAFPLFSEIKRILLVIKIGKTNLAAANYINSFLDKKGVEKNILAI